MKVLSPVEELQRTYLNPCSVRKLDRGKLSRAAREQSDPKFGITFGAGQNKTLVYNGGTISSLMSPPSTEAPVKGCWPDGCDEPGLQLLPATPAAAPVSLSLCVLLSECCLPTTSRQC